LHAHQIKPQPFDCRLDELANFTLQIDSVHRARKKGASLAVAPRPYGGWESVVA
jgi:hypothetical protein